MNPYRVPAKVEEDVHCREVDDVCPLAGLSQETQDAYVAVGGCVCKSCFRARVSWNRLQTKTK
jgi:hypothetical protein